MTPLHRIEERLRGLSPWQAFVLVAGANLILVGLAFALPADGGERGPALLSILGNFHILALHVPAAVLLIVPLFEFFERHEAATATVRRLSVFSAAGTWGAVLCGILHAHFNGFEGDAVQLHLWGGIAASIFAGIASLLLSQGNHLQILLNAFFHLLIAAVLRVTILIDNLEEHHVILRMCLGYNHTKEVR
jgi:hypothetical protein